MNIIATNCWIQLYEYRAGKSRHTLCNVNAPPKTGLVSTTLRQCIRFVQQQTVGTMMFFGHSLRIRMLESSVDAAFTCVGSFSVAIAQFWVIQIASKGSILGYVAIKRWKSLQLQVVRGKDSEEERTRSLLDLIPTKGQTAYEELMTFLSSHKSWLHERLLELADNITAGRSYLS